MYTGRKLTSAGGLKGREMDMKQMMIWGNLIRAQQPAAMEANSADLVPKSWQLHCRTADSETKALAGDVLAYDIDAAGRVVYTNGNAVFLLHPDGHKERVLCERMIEQLFFVPQDFEDARSIHHRRHPCNGLTKIRQYRQRSYVLLSRAFRVVSRIRNARICSAACTITSKRSRQASLPPYSRGNRRVGSNGSISIAAFQAYCSSRNQR